MSKVKILVVEDEIIIARELEARLQGLGYEVVDTAASGTKALAIAEATQPDLVLMDIVLKGNMDGVETAEHIRRRYRIPVIYLTAFTDKATLARAQVTQPYAYLVKPFAERELYANIEMTLYRHRVESQLRAMEIWFAASMQKIADGVLGTTNTEGSISYLNPAAERLTGWSKEEAVGRNAREVFRLARRADEKGVCDPVLQTLTDGITVELKDILLVNRTGESIPVNFVGACLRDDYGDPIGVVLVVRDLRQQKQVEQSLTENQKVLEAQRQAALNLAQDEMAARERAQQAEQKVRKLNAELEQRVQDRTAQLEAANKELEAFSYSVSHDLRAPLRAIDGFSRILLEEYAPLLPDDGQRYLRIARENTQRMGQLIDDLLALSHLGRQSLETKSVAPTALVKAVLADLLETAGRQVEVVVGELGSCQVDASLLRQVFVNLLANALKFTRAQPAARIEIGCRTGDAPGQFTYFVKDNGAGFDMQYAHKLFGVFQRLHRAEDYPGTGVGLAIVQRIIHRHGGRVWAEGAVDQGATFYFTLPQGVDS